MCDNEQQFEYMDMYDPETNRIYREQVSMEVVEETYDSDFTNTEEQDGNVIDKHDTENNNDYKETVNTEVDKKPMIQK